MEDAFYNNKLRVAVVGTANVAQTVAFIAEHERSTNIKYFVIDDASQIDILRGLSVVFMITTLTDEATCKTAHFIADFVKNENVILPIAIVQSASNEFSEELRYLEQNFGVVINLEEQQNNQPVEDFSYQIVHGIHSVYDEEFYPNLVPIDFSELLELLTGGRKSFVRIGESSGENAVGIAMNAALDSPLIKKSLQNVCSIFVKIMGFGDSLSLMEVNEAINAVYDEANPDADICWEVNSDESLDDKVFVIVFIRVP